MLSVIIVSYNARHFTEHCLFSVRKAIAGIETEIIVVDNNSSDQSVAVLKEIFPEVIFIANQTNTGYARANNQGFQLSKGDYILFLNPDTILTENCLQQSIALLAASSWSGAVGIRMLDGTGKFLPESKRGFPSPKASFFRLAGLTGMFPRSKNIAGYYLGWLAENENHEVDVLSGAYMMVKRMVLEQTGCFDEQFFMYGEDIDLSYRIRQAGFTNHYLGTSNIVHFKGESTRKNIRYTKIFYKAMDIFVRKHYREARGTALLMRLGITVSGALAVLGRGLEGRGKSTAAWPRVQSMLAGDPEDTTKAAAILGGTNRQLVQVADLATVYNNCTAGSSTEIVFCAGKLSYKKILAYMIQLAGSGIAFKFYAAGSSSIVGSGSKNSSGEVIGG